MKTTYLILSFLSFAVFSTTAPAQKRMVFLDSANNGYSAYADIAEGEIATVTIYGTTGVSSQSFLKYKSDTVAERNYFINPAIGIDPSTRSLPKFPGPCQLRTLYQGGGTSHAVLLVETEQNATTASSSSAKYATVIPENAKTNVSVILEQSTDLVTWSAVVPGDFAPSASKRFFRVRSANQPVAVTGATNASPIVLTSTGHNLVSEDVISVSGILGNTAANGIFTVTKVDANSFSLNGSSGNGAYVSGGTWLPNP
jgi:hypothetical protein